MCVVGAPEKAVAREKLSRSREPSGRSNCRIPWCRGGAADVAVE